MQTRTLIFAAAVMQLLGPRPAFVRTAYAEVTTTAIEEVVMYGIDADTYELLRYTFANDEYVRIGVVTDQNGNVVTDMESLAFIPNGPDKGIYGTANWYESKPTRLVKINPLDATGYVYPNQIGFAKGEGLVAAQSPVTGDWVLIGASKHDDPGDKDSMLFTIDPATGIGTFLMDPSPRFQGLALGPNGKLWGVTRDPGRLYNIDPASGSETLIDDVNGYDNTEALEWAFGDNLPRIDCTPTVPASWTLDGVLFSFDDDKDSLLILNPANGDAIRYDCSFQTIDCEGLVFTTQFRDSFGAIVVDACD